MSTNISDSPASATNQVLQVICMRYGISLQSARKLVDGWLQQNPAESFQSFRGFLQANQILIKNGSLIDLRQISTAQLDALTALLRGPQGVEIKDRRYKTRKYEQCFLGNEAVACLQNVYGATLQEALRLGELLVERRVLHHVLDEHGFENEALFYRFYQDEKD